MGMHVFVDTNVLLSFFHFTSEDLESLNGVFVSHKKGAAVLHLTDQVRDEFRRNRESKIADALSTFKNSANAVKIPTFMRTLEDFEALEKAGDDFRKLHAAMLKAANEKIIDQTLPADSLIDSMFNKAKPHATTTKIYSEARQRVDVGNPPGKNGSLGDAINWLLLMEHVPKGEDLFVISGDKDFYSTIEDTKINPFLEDEWQREKGSKVTCYRSLRAFLGDHFAGVTLSFDPEKMELLNALASSSCFATTHALVAKLDSFPFFSLHEAKTLLDAAHANDQVRWIVADTDVRALFLKATAPHKGSLKDPVHLELIEKAQAGWE
jgi:hypothetical protein